ncbi:MAG: ATP synthase epsilon chain [Firmicutes bacterium ADurb.Bin248]|jgi:F-type H+-transporting ATPase subunit epsilon|nr:MAG: ATP synthase epsilon chain [Firmicutes bacterium ADurb.Bin248]HOG01700.1 ATP synthase F1 subunit epsilon [Clostridia bacterium]HPK15880.1 ATP synthase F1 subunit epsilon [Clostridia bacterium]
MAKTFRLMVLTPEREFFNGDAAYVGVNTIAGSIGVLADHIPMVSALDVGTLTIRAQDGGARTAFHSEGFIEVRADGVYVLCQACEWPEEIDEKRALEAEHRAEERLARPAEDAQVFKRNRVALMRALTRRKIKSMSSINTR